MLCYFHCLFYKFYLYFFLVKNTVVFSFRFLKDNIIYYYKKLPTKNPKYTQNVLT